MDRHKRLRRIAELEADRNEVDVELARLDVLRVHHGLTRVQDSVYGWLWQRRKDINAQLSEMHDD